MTETLAVGRPATAGRQTFRGTRLLLGLALRRDRIRLPIWIVAIAVFVPYFGGVLTVTSGGDVQGAVDELSAARGMIDIFAGPLYGLDEATLPRYFLMYTQEFLLISGVMNILLMVRHTRGDEQAGRAELVRSAVIGRHAPLTAALLVAVIANLALAVLLALGAATIGFGLASAALWAAGVGVTGMLFAAVTAITAQIAEGSRVAGGLAGVVLAVASVVRGVTAGGEGENAGQWLSPMTWPHLSRVLVEGERWWPLLIPLLLAALLTAIAYSLADHRDVGAGMIPLRPGRVRGGRWWGSPASLAARLMRRSLGWWALAMFLLGLAWGSLARVVEPGQIASLQPGILGAPNVQYGYLSLVGATQVFLVAVFAVLSVNRIRAEETEGRLEPALATPTGRVRWLASWLAVIVVSILVLHAVIGLATGWGAAAATGDGSLIGTMAVAVVARAPEVLVLTGIAAALYGLAPRWQGGVWAVLGYAVIARFFGTSLAWPEWIMGLSPFQQIPRMPLDPFDPLPVFVLLALAAALFATALAAFRRRDV